MPLCENYVRDFFNSRHFASKCHIRHNSSYSASIAMATYCFNLAAILAVSVMHSSSSENCGHVNMVRKTRRVALLYIPVLCPLPIAQYPPPKKKTKKKRNSPACVRFIFGILETVINGDFTKNFFTVNVEI